jgi:hypothetical protein
MDRGAMLRQQQGERAAGAHSAIRGGMRGSLQGAGASPSTSGLPALPACCHAAVLVRAMPACCATCCAHLTAK